MPFPQTAMMMGYIGRVQIGKIGAVRALSVSLNPKQAITHPDVIDNRIDRTLFQLGPIEVDGDIAIPMIAAPRAGGEGGTNTFLTGIWGWTVVRDPQTGNVPGDGETITLQYSYKYSRQFYNCKANTFEIRATAGDRAESTINVMGTKLDPGGTSGDPIDYAPARVLMWSDIAVTGTVVGTDLESCQAREFTLTINNNLSRNYTFCREFGMYASNITAGKRYVNGTFGFQGYSPTDNAAFQNVTRDPADTINFDFAGFSKTAYNVIYEFQVLDFNPGLITSTVNWYAHGSKDGPAIDD